MSTNNINYRDFIYENERCRQWNRCPPNPCSYAEPAGQSGPRGPMGRIGLQGPKGEDGKSAYQIALANGYVGTEKDWLSNLKGEAGAKGSDGLAATISVAASARVPFNDNPYVENIGTPQAAVLKFGIPAGVPGAPGQQGAKGEKGDTGVQGRQGLKGDPGVKGADGLSAFEIAKEHGFSGTEEEWLASVKGAKGEKGEKGDTGAQGDKGLKGDTGAKGADGLSAFEIAKEHGYSGTEEEWLASVKGAKGDKGEKGEKGDTGAQGEKGAKGDPGSLEKGDKLFTVVGPNDSVDINYDDNLVFTSKTLDISVHPDSSTVAIEKKSSDTEGYFIPFGTGYAAVSIPTTNSSGESVNVVNMGFGESGPGHALTSPGSGVFTINAPDAWYTFTMPKDAVLKGISHNVTNGVSLPVGTATISPYVVIATAPPTSRTFTFIDATLTRSSESFLNGVLYPQYQKTVAGESSELNVPLKKGTQVSIVFGINTTAPGAMIQGNYMICSGGLWFQ